MIAPPHPMAPGATDEDYYRGNIQGGASPMTTLLADAVTRTSTGEAVLFWILGTVAVIGAVGMVTASKAVYSAMFLAMTMIVLAVFYIAQDALFLGVVQVVVYTGAVMMLFLFVMMLIGVDTAESLVETIRGQRIAALLAGLGFGVLLIAGIGTSVDGVHRSGSGECGGQRRGVGGADLHPLPVGVRGHQCTADHRGDRCDGAGAPGTL